MKKNGKPKDNGQETEGKPIRDEHGLFLEGNPGGPGRPAGTVNAITVLKRKAAEEGTTVEAMAWDVLRAQQRAGSLNEKPDPAAARIFLDRACGPVKQQTDLTSGGQPIGTGPTPPQGEDRIQWLRKSLEIAERRNGSAGG